MNANIVRLHAPARKRAPTFTPDAVREILGALAKLDRRIERLERVARPTEFLEDTHE